MSIITIPTEESKLNVLTRTNKDNNNDLKKKMRKLNKHVRFTNPLVSHTKIIHYPRLSSHEKEQLFYNEYDIQQFLHEYHRSKYEQIYVDNNVENCPKRTTVRARVTDIIKIIIACIRVFSYLFYVEVMRPLLLKLKTTVLYYFA